MHVELPELHTSATLTFDPEDRLSDEKYVEFLEANPDLRVERTADGKIVIVPPAGAESDNRNTKVTAALDRWAEEQGRGEAFGSSVQFLLPDGSALSPNAAWVSNERLESASKRELRGFPRLVPEFVIEVMSPSDRLASAKRKMKVWTVNGVELAWLIDGDSRSVYVFRRDQEMRTYTDISEIVGEGSIAGFILKLQRIWRGLSDYSDTSRASCADPARW